jgi:hypothetical protein
MISYFSSILSTAKDLESLFGSVKHKLLNNPTEASAKLAEALGELSRIKITPGKFYCFITNRLTTNF